ncbi:MAG: hypothetical protein U9O94_05425 [Nanoarchaeota archaeon]|nr:hypothetical protein [Nanoarchaeota archaeon]
MRDSKLGFFIVDIILLIVFLGLLRLVFRLSGWGFLLEVLAIVILLFISFIALIPAYSGSRGGWAFLSGVFILALLDLVVLHLRSNIYGLAFLGTLLFAALGFVLAIMKIQSADSYEEQDDEEAYTNFEPGKYVASKRGSTYHAPKCDWAEKIDKKNRVWLESDSDAKKKGYKKHSCLK